MEVVAGGQASIQESPPPPGKKPRGLPGSASRLSATSLCAAWLGGLCHI